jgi:hypothetical protein
VNEPFGWFTTIGTIATAVGVIVVGILRYRDRRETAAENRVATKAALEAKDAAESADAKLAEIDGKIYRLTEQVDGKLSKLLDLTRESALAKGRLEGIASEKADAASNGGRREADPA